MTRTTYLLFALVACGSSGKKNNGPPDAPPPPPCDYTEASDATNDKTTEMTALSISDTTKNICANVDPGHYDMVTSAVDTDTFRITLAAQSDLLFRTFGQTGIETLGNFSVMIFDTQANPTLLNGGKLDTMLGDHGVFAASLPAGDYDVVMVARNTADVAAPIPYKVRIIPDMPMMRCPTISDPAAYTEAHDNADNLGNDVVDVDFGKDPSFSLTAATTDAPEPSGVTLDADKPMRVSGSSANVTGPDEYGDRDTYQLMTGAMTNEVALRLDWPAGGADLDSVMFVDSQMVATGAATRSDTSGDEITTFAVKPSTSYWVWVGGVKGSTGLPAAYDVSLCGTAVDPDWR